MNRVWSFARAHGLDALVLIAAGASALEAAFRSDPARDPDTSTWFAAPAIALLVLPLLARRRFPFAAPASVWLLAASLSFADGRLVTYSPIAFIAGFVAAFLIGNVRDAAQARIGLGLVVAAAAIVVSNDPTHDTGDFAFTPLLFAISWLAGFAMRGRAEQVEAAELRAIQAERERETAARIAVAEERARIARELHDIVAHAVSVMVLQVGAVRHGLATVDPESREALARVERTGRTALAEMRRLLGAMRDGEEVALGPQPGLSDLEPLLDQVGDAGLPVELHIDGDPRPLPEALDLTAYRIVQEGLTNALKHAHASRAEVTVRYRSGELDIEIRDDGRGAGGGGSGNGHGLLGVRERVKVYGGEMTAGAGSEAGFVLRTRLPLERYGE